MAGGPSMQDSREMEMVVSSDLNSNGMLDEAGISKHDMIEYLSQMIKTNSGSDKLEDSQNQIANQLMKKVFMVHKNSMESTDNEML